VSFTGSEYLDSIDFFGSGKENLDGDGFDYTYDSGTNQISLSGALISGSPAQTGSLTAKVKADAPHGAIITAKLSFDDDQLHRIGFNSIFGTKTHAAEVAYSTVRISVSNPVAQTTAAPAATVLPATGTPSSSSNKTLTYTFISAIALLTGSFIVRKKIKAKN